MTQLERPPIMPGTPVWWGGEEGLADPQMGVFKRMSTEEHASVIVDLMPSEDHGIITIVQSVLLSELMTDFPVNGLTSDDTEPYIEHDHDGPYPTRFDHERFVKERW